MPFITTAAKSCVAKNSVQAARDNDFMHDCVNRGLNDPFVVTSKRVVDANVLNVLINQIPLEVRRTENEFAAVNFATPVESRAHPIGETRSVVARKQKIHSFLERLVIALVGGAFLVVPVWIMVLYRAKYTSLVVTSSAVVLCGIVTAWKLERSEHVLSVTAAYAAVLVVFVGSNSDAA